MRARSFLAAVGDANSPVTWSGIPYHFLQAGRAQGLLDEGLPLSTEGKRWYTRRVAWNLASKASGDRYGGYQYSRAFLEKLWAPVISRIRGSVVINCFQLFPPSVVENRSIEKWFFTDQTLLQLFDFYGIRPANHVHVVVPGANIDPVEYERWESQEEQRRANDSGSNRRMRLVFVGKEWRRKGLDRLLRAIALARRSGFSATLRVIGCRRESLPNELRDVAGVEWLSFIDKSIHPAEFLRAVGECDVGCLLSRAEAGGIALREYHALGLVVLGTDSGGAPEHMIHEACVLLSTQSTDEAIASELLRLEADVSRFVSLKEAAWRTRRRALWTKTVERILGFWPHQNAEMGNMNRLIAAHS